MTRVPISHSFSFHVEEWYGDKPYMTLVKAEYFDLADVVYEYLIRKNPTRYYRLRHGANVKKERKP